jgi:hypothetical protein
MENPAIPQTVFLDGLRALVTEAYLGPPDPRGTWFVDNEAHSGFIGILDRVSAVRASVVEGYPAGASIAGHAYHIRFALDLVVRAARGDNAHETARWSESWARNAVTDQEWDVLRADLRRLVADLEATLVPGAAWSDPGIVVSAMAVVAHGAWHLGAIRQLASR